MQAQQNIAQIQQKFVIQVDNQIAKIVAPADRQEIAKAYLQMFAGFALVNWTNKYSLGRAWQTALGQCGSFIESKGSKNPAAKHLANTYAGHKKQWSRVIMMHSARENTINPNDDKIKQLRAHGSKMIQAAMDKINLILARYNEFTEEMIAGQQQTQQSPAPQAQQSSQNHVPEHASQSAQTQSQTTQPAQALPQEQEKQHTQQITKPAMQYAVKSATNTVAQSGAFAMTRDNVKRPSTVATEITDNAHTAQKVQEKQLEKNLQQKVVLPEINQQKTEAQKPIVHHTQKSVAQPVKQSGALPAVRDTVKQPNVVKQVEKKREPYVAPRVDVTVQFERATQNIQMKSTQLQFNIKRNMNLFTMNNFNQRAA